MTARAWLRHPPRTVGQPTVCPTRLPRFATVALAREALHHGYADHQLTAWECGQCGGWHVTDQAQAPAGDCEPDWTPHTRAITTIRPAGDHL